MSPLARIRQVATCALLLFGLPVLAAEAPAQPAQPAQPTQALQPAQTAQPAQADGKAQTAPSGQADQKPQTIQLAPNAAVRIAHSALLTIDGIATADTLKLQIRRAGDQSLLSSDDVAVTVTVDGRNESVTRTSDGDYEIPSNDLRGDGAQDLQIVVAHDGIREILSGKVSLAEPASTHGLLSDHKQIAWWILNIVIVLIAAIAISRRKG